jgi:hypothetical protein
VFDDITRPPDPSPKVTGIRTRETDDADLLAGDIHLAQKNREAHRSTSVLRRDRLNRHMSRDRMGTLQPRSPGGLLPRRPQGRSAAVVAVAFAVLLLGSLLVWRVLPAAIGWAQGDSPSARAQIRSALSTYFSDVRLAARTANCSRLRRISGGTVFRQERNLCNVLAGEGAHKEIRDIDPPVFLTIDVSGDSALAVVRKRQQILFIHDKCGQPDDVDACGALGDVQTHRNLRYTTDYSLERRDGAWMVVRAVVQPSQGH